VGVDRRKAFPYAEDHRAYLRLLRDNLADAQAAILGFWLMTNHVHLIAVPEREDSLAVLLRRVHGRYAQYWTGRTGHLWQNRPSLGRQGVCGTRSRAGGSGVVHDISRRFGALLGARSYQERAGLTIGAAETHNQLAFFANQEGST
jgi:hypothetical protein